MTVVPSAVLQSQVVLVFGMPWVHVLVSMEGLPLCTLVKRGSSCRVPRIGTLNLNRLIVT